MRLFVSFKSLLIPAFLYCSVLLDLSPHFKIYVTGEATIGVSDFPALAGTNQPHLFSPAFQPTDISAPLPWLSNVDLSGEDRGSLCICA